MKHPEYKMENGGWRARNVLECGSAPPLSHPPQYPPRSPIVSDLLISLAVVALAVLPAMAQSYSINWAKIAGGGGTSTNGQYALTGTIGQSDAGSTMTNGLYSLTGGFWVLPIAVQTPGAPTLGIAPSAPGKATISWLPNTPGFVLQETLNLTAPSWTNSPSGTTNPTVVPAVLPTKFYRLHQP
jgi:hypothetical protein